jgi:hypothetical protein
LFIASRKLLMSLRGSHRVELIEVYLSIFVDSID